MNAIDALNGLLSNNPMDLLNALQAYSSDHDPVDAVYDLMTSNPLTGLQNYSTNGNINQFANNNLPDPSILFSNAGIIAGNNPTGYGLGFIGLMLDTNPNPGAVVGGLIFGGIGAGIGTFVPIPGSTIVGGLIGNYIGGQFGGYIYNTYGGSKK
jgi:hypothetical protein